MLARDPDLCREDVLALLDFDPSTGEFRWKISRNNRTKPGSLAGHVGKAGYRRITLGRKRVMAQRIVWLITYGEWPTVFVDHCDEDKLNNRPSNLRLATKSQNKMNTSRHAGNKSGVKGVHFRPEPQRRLKPWAAQISINGKQKTIGYFSTLKEAAAARKVAALELHGEFATERVAA